MLVLERNIMLNEKEYRPWNLSGKINTKQIVSSILDNSHSQTYESLWITAFSWPCLLFSWPVFHHVGLHDYKVSLMSPCSIDPAFLSQITMLSFLTSELQWLVYLSVPANSPRGSFKTELFLSIHHCGT